MVENVRYRWLKLVLFLLAVAVVPYQSYQMSRDSGRCSPWRWRDVEVTAAEYAAASKYVNAHMVKAPGFVGKITNREGVAFPGTIVVLDGHTDDISLLAHETLHLHQMQRDGLARYTMNYIRDLLTGVWYGCDLYASYMAVSYERHAHIAGNVTATRERQAHTAEEYRQRARTAAVAAAPQR